MQGKSVARSHFEQMTIHCRFFSFFSAFTVLYNFFSKFQSVNVNWHKYNDNYNKVSKQATNDNITTALYTSFFEISAQLGSY